MKCNKQNHLKKLLIMEYIAVDSKKQVGSSILIERIKEKDLIKFPEQGFCDLEKKIKKGLPFMGIYDKEKNILGFGCTQPKGKRADYFNIKKCDIYISDLFIYPEYQGQGIMKCFLETIVSAKGIYRLCVRSNNTFAIRCYEKCGFKIIGSKRVLRIYKGWSFPRYSI